MGRECQLSGDDGRTENKSVGVTLVDTGAEVPILVHKIYVDFDIFC